MGFIITGVLPPSPDNPAVSIITLGDVAGDPFENRVQANEVVELLNKAMPGAPFTTTEIIPYDDLLIANAEYDMERTHHA